MSLQTVRAFLAAHAPELSVVETPQRTATVAEAAAVHGVATGQIAKTLSLWVGEQPVLLVMGGDARIDNAKFKACFKTKARMLDAQEVEQWTGHPVGGVCPFGLAHPLTVYADASLRAYDEVVPAAGSAHSAVRVSVERLVSLTRAQWVDVAKVEQAVEAVPALDAAPATAAASGESTGRATALEALAALVVKERVSLGLLPPEQRGLALAVAALRLPPAGSGAVAREPEVNALLKASLQEECAFLSTDHVELRRWLVDTGLWQRDDYGRGYAATPAAQWPAPVAAQAAAVASLGDADAVRAWVARRRDAVRQARLARRQVWHAQQAEQVQQRQQE